jgi:hypothetical protein
MQVKNKILMEKCLILLTIINQAKTPIARLWRKTGAGEKIREK